MSLEPKDFIQIVEVSDGNAVAGHIFQRKYGSPPPDVPRHFVALYRTKDNLLVPITYLHCRRFGAVCLVGGACTDGRAFAQMQAHEREAITPENGVMLLILRAAFARLEHEYDAFFGYCGDARALSVDLQAGFLQTDHPHVLVKWNKPLDAEQQQTMMEQIVALGPF